MLKQIKIITLLILIQGSTIKSFDVIQSLFRRNYKSMGLITVGLGLLAWKLYSNYRNNYDIDFPASSADGSLVNDSTGFTGSATSGSVSSSYDETESGRSSANLIRRKYDVKDFNHLKVTDSITVILTQSDSESIIVEAEENIISNLEVSCESSKLYVGFKESRSISLSQPIKYFINFKQLNSLNITDSAKVVINSLSSESLFIACSGAASVEGNLNLKTLTVNISGLTSLNLSGKTNYQNINIYGSARYDAQNLESKTTHVFASEKANLKLNVSNELHGKIYDEVSLRYKNDPKIDIEQNDNASIHKLCN